jgi:hypothetical protein
VPAFTFGQCWHAHGRCRHLLSACACIWSWPVPACVESSAFETGTAHCCVVVAYVLPNRSLNHPKLSSPLPNCQTPCPVRGTYEHTYCILWHISLPAACQPYFHARSNCCHLALSVSPPFHSGFPVPSFASVRRPASFSTVSMAISHSSLSHPRLAYAAHATGKALCTHLTCTTVRRHFDGALVTPSQK